MSFLSRDIETSEAIQCQAVLELKRRITTEEILTLNQYISSEQLLQHINKYGFGILKFYVITVGNPSLHCKVSLNRTPPDGDCLMHAIADGLLNKQGLEARFTKQRSLSEDLQSDLQVYKSQGQNASILRQRWVLRASDWLSGKHGSLQNMKCFFDYTDSEWNFF